MGEPKKKRWILTTKENASKFAIACVSLLVLIQVIAAVITGSIAIRADAIHSIIDLTGVTIGYFGIRIGCRPPDRRHAFGHGKAENIASAIIAGIIFAAAGTIFYEAVKRLIAGGVIELLDVGIYLWLGVIVINGAGSWWVLRVARATDSVALEASGRDMLADFYSSLAVLLGLGLVRLTGLNLFAPIVAILVAGVVARTGYITMKKAIGGLMDTKLPEAEEEAIRSCIVEHSTQLVGFHAVRTRKAGSQRFIDLHLVMPKYANVEETHQMCDHLEQAIENRLRNSNITIHVEPCDEECDQCYIITCRLRQEKS